MTTACACFMWNVHAHAHVHAAAGTAWPRVRQRARLVRSRPYPSPFSPPLPCFVRRSTCASTGSSQKGGVASRRGPNGSVSVARAQPAPPWLPFTSTLSPRPAPFTGERRRREFEARPTPHSEAVWHGRPAAALGPRTGSPASPTLPYSDFAPQLLLAEQVAHSCPDRASPSPPSCLAPALPPRHVEPFTPPPFTPALTSTSSPDARSPTLSPLCAASFPPPPSTADAPPPRLTLFTAPGGALFVCHASPR